MLTEAPLCRESHPLCRLKNPTVVYMITCRLSFCKTGVYNVCLLRILERGCSSMYRKKERLDKSYAKEPLLAFLKAILVNITLKIALFSVIDSVVRIQASTSKHFQEIADVKYWHDVKKKPLRHARESNTHPHVKRHFLAPVEVPEITFLIGRVQRPTGIQGSPVRS